MFGDVTVHPMSQETLSITGHGVCRHGDNRCVRPGCAFSLTNRSGGFQPIHYGHLNVHKNQVEAFPFDRFQSLDAITHHDHEMSFPLQQP